MFALQVEPLAVHPNGDVADASQESSQVRSAQSTWSYEGSKHPAKQRRASVTE
jgi:hypothetical protein